MKKILPLLMIIGLLSFAAPAGEKLFVLQFTGPQLNVLWEALQKSDAPYQQVAPIIDQISRQYTPQMQAYQDSVQRSQPKDSTKKK